MTAPLQTQLKADSTWKPSFMPMRSGLLQRKCACGGMPGPTGECAECKKKRLQRQARSVPAPATIPATVNDTLRSPGDVLEPATRAAMESRFGHSFAHVRIHADERAAESARDVNALAYTVGRDVVFGASQFRPESETGRRLLAHELVHTIQQRGAEGGPPQSIIAPNDHSEREADEAASTVVSGKRFSNNIVVGSSLTWPVIQRKKEGEQSLLLQDAPEYPGCSPFQRFRLNHEIQLARNMIEAAIRAVSDELARTDRDSGTISIAGSAISSYFHTNDARHIRTMLAQMKSIAARLGRRPWNWRCLSSEAECRKECGLPADACASPDIETYITGSLY